MPEIIPAEHDARQYAIICQASDTRDKLFAGRDRMHRMAGDRKRWIGKSQVWQMSWAEVMEVMKRLVAQGDEKDLSYGARPSGGLARDTELLHEIARLDALSDAMEATWRAHGWTRYFPCLNADGHIHVSLNSCPTIHRNGKATSMGWATELSGLTVAEAIKPENLGPRLCSVCFPDAPVEHCRSLREITREQRDAERAERQAARELAGQARETRRLAREAKAELPRKETPQERRYAGMRALGDKFQPVAGYTREEVATAIEELASLGKAPKWQDAISAWARAVRDEENDITWAFSQYSVYASYAA
jgi:hypothetical protein